MLPLLVLFVTAGGSGAAEGIPGLGLFLKSRARADDRLRRCRDAPAPSFPATAIDDRGLDAARPRADHPRQWLAARTRVFYRYPARRGQPARPRLPARLVGQRYNGSITLIALADLAAVANAWIQAPLIALFLSFSYLFFRQEAAAGMA